MFYFNRSHMFQTFKNILTSQRNYYTLKSKTNFIEAELNNNRKRVIMLEINQHDSV